MAGTGSNATTEAVRLTRVCRQGRARTGRCWSPRTTTDRLRKVCSPPTLPRLPRACDLPQVLYNVPSRTGRNVEAETVERLAGLGPIVAVKEASGSLDQVSDLIARTDLTILSGDDSLTLPMMAVGAEGVVSVVGNLVPQDVMALIRAFRDGDLVEAQRRHSSGFSRSAGILLGVASNPIPVKQALGHARPGQRRAPAAALFPPDDAGTETPSGAPWSAMGHAR